MSELIVPPQERPHPDRVNDVYAWGLLDRDTLQRYVIEQTPGYETHFAPYKGSRRLALEMGGPIDGRVIIFWHGTPGGRLSPKPDIDYLIENNVRLITPDRFGFGFSTNEPLTGPFDAPRYLDIILKYIQPDSKPESIDVIGRSGGGPYALASATLRPELINAMVCIASLAPPEAFSLEEWLDGMCESNTRLFGDILGWPAPRDDPDYEARRERYYQATERIIELAADIQQRPTALFDDEHGIHGRRDDERHYKIASALAHYAGLRPGASGWLRDIYSHNDWGFDVKPLDPKIKSMVVTLADDVFSPPQHGRRLAELTGATRHVELPGVTHLSAIGLMKEAIEWCLANATSSVDPGRS